MEERTQILHQGSISPTHLRSAFYACRSRKRKKTDDLTVLFTLLGSARVKAVCRTLVKLTPGRFRQHLTQSFYAQRSQICKKTV